MAIKCLINNRLVMPDEVHVYIGAELVRTCKKPQGLQRLMDYSSAQINYALGKGKPDDIQRARDWITKTYPAVIISD